MLNFLLWNVQKRPLGGLVLRLVEEQEIDVIALVETFDDGNLTTRALNGLDRGPYERIPSHERFSLIVRQSKARLARIVPPISNERMDLWEVRPGVGRSFLLVLVHGLDRIWNRENRRELFFERVTENILWAEWRLGHKRTIVVGDFNENPFDRPLASARGLHAIRMREIAGRTSRSILGKDYEFFYNPMWNCYGGPRGSQRGTYYHYKYDEFELFWHMLDQVVLRPDALFMFDERTLRIVNTVGFTSLVRGNGEPDGDLASDHLPLAFRLNPRARRARNAR